MAMNVQLRDHSACISVAGRFEFETHRDFKNAYLPLLDKATIREIEIDMNRVSFLDSSALGMLMLLHERAANAGKSVFLVNVSDYAGKVLSTSNFDRLFVIRSIP